MCRRQDEAVIQQRQVEAVEVGRERAGAVGPVPDRARHERKRRRSVGAGEGVKAAAAEHLPHASCLGRLRFTRTHTLSTQALLPSRRILSRRKDSERGTFTPSWLTAQRVSLQ